VGARPPPLHESVRTHQVRVSRAKTRTAHHPDRPSNTHRHASPSVLPQTTHHWRDYRLREDELLAGGASSTSSRTTAGLAARSGPGQRARSSACRRGGDHHRGTYGACGACGSCWKAPSTDLCGRTGGCAQCCCKGCVRWQGRACCAWGALGMALATRYMCAFNMLCVYERSNPKRTCNKPQ
jgi:hypothetical protein